MTNIQTLCSQPKPSPSLSLGLCGGFEKTWGPFGAELTKFILSGDSDLNRYLLRAPQPALLDYSQGLFDFCSHFAGLHDAHAERLFLDAFCFGARWNMGALSYALRIETSPICEVRGFYFAARSLNPSEGLHAPKTDWNKALALCEAEHLATHTPMAELPPAKNLLRSL